MQLDTSSHGIDQVVDCGMWKIVPLLFNSCVNYWILAGTWTCCRARRSRASQTCSMGDMSGESAGHWITGTFSASRNCVKILATWGHDLSCWNMRWWRRMNGRGIFGCAGGWLQTIPQMKKPDVEVLGWLGYTTFEEAHGREINIQFSVKSSGGHFSSQHAHCMLPQNLRHCVVWQNCTFKIGFLLYPAQDASV